MARSDSDNEMPSQSPPRSQPRRVLYLSGWNVQAVHEGIADYARQAGWVLDNTMCYSAEIPRGVRADGILCRHAADGRIIDAAYSHGVPVVTFEADRRCDWPRVCYDELAIGEVGARHLIERGFQTLCFLHLRITDQSQRIVGFRREVERAGRTFVELAPEVAPPTWNPPPGESWRWLREALCGLSMPIGLMVTNDQIARPLIEALLDMGRHVPAEIAVISAENDPLLCEVGRPAVSSVDTDTRRMGHVAAELLDGLMAGRPASSEPVWIAPRGVAMRSSTNVRALPNLHAAEALHTIWERFREPIRIEDVAEGIPLTRRHLQTLFREQVGCTMREELARVRLAEAGRLLVSTDLPVGDVARRSGFARGGQMHRAFAGSLGMSPREFRRGGQMPDPLPLPVAGGMCAWNS